MLSGSDRVAMWKSNSLLLTELVDHMPSLYAVMQQAHSNNPEVQFVVAVPPDEVVPGWAKQPDGRLSQAFVRSHIFRLRGGRVVHNLVLDASDDSVSVEFNGLSENIVATLAAAKAQPDLRQTFPSDVDNEAGELFDDDVHRIIADEKREHAQDVAQRQQRRLSTARAGDLNRSTRRGEPSPPFTIRTGPLDASLRLRTSWTTRERCVKTYASELVRNTGASGKRAASEPFMLLLFVDEPVYCELDWAGIEPGTSPDLSADAAAQASIRQAISGEVASSPSPAAVDSDVRTRQSWLGDLFAEIAYAVPKASDSRPESLGGATARDGGGSPGRDRDNDDARSASASAQPDDLELSVSQQHTARGQATSRSVVDTSRRRKVQRMMPRTFEAAPMCRALLSLVDSAVADKVMLRLDTEAVIFESTYVCVPGFEEFTVAKVNAVVEALTQEFIRDVNAKAGKRPTASGDAAGAPQPQGAAAEESHSAPFESPATYPRKLTEEAERGLSQSGIRDNDVDVVVTAVHAITTAAFAPVLVPHWRELHQAEDAAFHMECVELNALLDRKRDPRNDGVSNTTADFSRTAPAAAPIIDAAQHGGRRGRDEPPAASMFGLNVRSVPETALEPAVHLLREFDASFSVFTYMRVAERALTVAMQVMAAEGFPLTADISIPVLMYLLVRASPQRLRSTVAFVTSFRLEALDMSALGYSFTTVEAAAHQLAREYSELKASGAF